MKPSCSIVSCHFCWIHENFQLLHLAHLARTACGPPIHGCSKDNGANKQNTLHTGHLCVCVCVRACALWRNNVILMLKIKWNGVFFGKFENVRSCIMNVYTLIDSTVIAVALENLWLKISHYRTQICSSLIDCWINNTENEI